MVAIGVSKETNITLEQTKGILTLIHFIDDADLVSAREELNRLHATAPILDPTMYMKAGNVINLWVDFLRKLSDLKKAADLLIPAATKVKEDYDTDK